MTVSNQRTITEFCPSRRSTRLMEKESTPKKSNQASTKKRDFSTSPPKPEGSGSEPRFRGGLVLATASPSIKRKAPTKSANPKLHTDFPSLDPFVSPLSSKIPTNQSEELKEQSSKAEISEKINVLDESTSTPTLDKEPIVALPAYQRYANILQTQKEKTVLPLPQSFEVLLRTFSVLDSLCVVMAGRSQRIVFHKIQESVEKSTGHSFSHLMLGQILELWPESYKIEPITFIKNAKKQKSWTIELVAVPKSIELEERRQRFRLLLLEKVQEAHCKFLESINVLIPKGKNLLNWHPKFDIDSVSQLPVAELLLESSSKTSFKPQDVSDRVKDAFDLKDSQLLTSSKAQTQSINPTKEKDNGSTEKKALSVLDRIKAKEAATALDLMLGNSEKQRIRALLTDISDFVDVVTLAFNSCKKTSLSYSFLSDKIVGSFRSSISQTDVKHRFDLVSKACPGWLSFSDPASEIEYIKIDKSKSRKEIDSMIDAYAKSL